MTYLLDTHTLIWMASLPDRLSPLAVSICQDRSNILLMSIVNVWEMQIKLQLGKLHLALPLETFVQQLQLNDIQLYPITLDHIYMLGSLPLHHRDPFDRLLIAQARFEGIPIITSDPAFDAYEIVRVWY